jgi:acyl carrier protein
VEAAPAVRASHPRPELATPYAAPRDELEETLAGLWGELLGIEKIGVHDRFYELGGNSLLATQLAARLADRLGIELPLELLLTRTTVAEQALAVAERQAERIGEERWLQMLAEIEGEKETEETEEPAADGEPAASVEAGGGEIDE